MHTFPLRWDGARGRGWLLAGLVVLVLTVSIQYTLKVLDSRRSAVLRWREQIQQLDAGENIYERYTYPNPPVMALILKPFTLLPPLAGALGWFYLKVALTVAAFAWVFRTVERDGVPLPPWVKAAAVLLSIRPVVGDLSHGNVNLWILFLIAGALYALSRGRAFTAGVALALAAACKVTPILFIPYLIWKRSWRAAAGAAVGLVLFLAVIPSAYLGWGENARLLRSWWQQMVTPYVVDGVVLTRHHNQSLPALAFRLATASPSFAEYDFGQDRYVPLRYHNVADLDPRAVRWFLKGCMLAFALACAWTCRNALGTTTGWQLTAEFGLVTLGMLLFSERTWKHHCVTQVLPLTAILYALAAHAPGWRLRAGLIGGLVVVQLLLASTSTSLLDLYREDAAKEAQAYGAYAWAHLILTGALLALVARRRGV